MRAQEFITEVFNLTSPQTVWSSGGTDTQATWTDKTGARVTTVFRKVGKTVDVSFVRTDAQGTPTWGRANNAGGSSSSVFGGVAANLKDYLAKNPNITHVTFGASDDPERSRLYSKIAQRAGAVGLELVDPRDRANIPPEIRRQDKTLPTLPTLGNKNTLPPPPASIDDPYTPHTQKYDQFILKRQNMPAQSRQIVPARTGDEYTNVYGGGRPSEFQNQQYVKDIQAKLQQFPNDPNLHAELASMQKRFPQP